jgi:hypothetical protein
MSFTKIGRNEVKNESEVQFQKIILNVYIINKIESSYDLGLRFKLNLWIFNSILN